MTLARSASVEGLLHSGQDLTSRELRARDHIRQTRQSRRESVWYLEVGPPLLMTIECDPDMQVFLWNTRYS